MAIKHATIKAPGQKVFAVADWNANHIIDSDVPFNNNKITGLKDPTLDQDATTKKYVDDEIAAIPPTNPGGNDTEVQFNDGGSFGGDSGFTYVKTTKQIQMQVGSGTSPSYSFPGLSNRNSGMYVRDPGSLTFASFGGDGLIIDSAANFRIVKDGTEGNPPWGFGSDTNTGTYRPASDKLGFVAGGREFLRLSETTQDELIVNENSYDIDFRVESDADTHAIFMEGSSGNVGIGTALPTSKLHVVGLPIYATNALAIAGGLTAGAFYRLGGDPDHVCVVH